MKNQFNKLKTLGVLVTDTEITVSNDKVEIGKTNLTGIEKVLLIKSNNRDYINFKTVLLKLFTNRLDAINKTSSTAIYKLKIILKNGSEIEKELQNFDLIGVSYEVNQLNESLKK